MSLIFSSTSCIGSRNEWLLDMQPSRAKYLKQQDSSAVHCSFGRSIYSFSLVSACSDTSHKTCLSLVEPLHLKSQAPNLQPKPSLISAQHGDVVCVGVHFRFWGFGFGVWRVQVKSVCKARNVGFWVKVYTCLQQFLRTTAHWWFKSNMGLSGSSKQANFACAWPGDC